MKNWARRLFSSSGGISSIGLLSLMELHHRVQTLRSVFVFFVVLLFLFSSINMKFHSRLTAFLCSIYLINLDQYSPAIPTLRRQKSNLNCPPFFCNFNPIRRLSVARNLSNQFSGVQISCDICTRFRRYLYSTKQCWVIKSNNDNNSLNSASSSSFSEVAFWRLSFVKWSPLEKFWSPKIKAFLKQDTLYTADHYEPN